MTLLGEPEVEDSKRADGTWSSLYFLGSREYAFEAKRPGNSLHYSKQGVLEMALGALFRTPREPRRTLGASKAPRNVRSLIRLMMQQLSGWLRSKDR
jgi:hypothetical protein